MAPETKALLQGRHHDPHSLLGRHNGLVRALRPGASEMYLLVTGPSPGRAVLDRVPMHQVHPGGLWEAPLDPAAAGSAWRPSRRPGSPGSAFDDPYRHWPTLGDLELHLFKRGGHRRLWEVLGAHPGPTKE